MHGRDGREVGGAGGAGGHDDFGPSAPLVRLLTDRITRRYVETEAADLKAYCERR